MSKPFVIIGAILAILFITFVAAKNPILGLGLALIFLATSVALLSHKRRKEAEDDARRHRRKRLSKIGNSLYGEDPYGLFDEQQNPKPKHKQSHGSWDDNPDRAPPIK